MRFAFALTWIWLLASCASSPTIDAPAWTQTPVRTIDNGYIVYVGKGEDASTEKAAFKAEAIAMGDLANECSFIPKGARVEDRYESISGDVYYAFAKIGIGFEECEAAKQATDPMQIRKMANVAMTEQWKRFQDLYYGPDKESSDSEQPEVADINDASDYYSVRQQVALEKQTIILAPASVYTVQSVQTQQATARLAPAQARLRFYERANPTLIRAQHGWSSFRPRPEPRFPAHSAPAFRGGGRGFARPPRPFGGGGFRRGGGGFRGGGRHFGGRR